MDNHLKTLADIVSSKKTVSDFNDKDTKLPTEYKELININKNIIDILNKMENPKPIKYKLLGEFQKMFLLRGDISNEKLKNNLDKLKKIVSTEDSIKKYEREQEFPNIMNELIQIDKDIINILNEIEDSPINYDDHLGKIQEIFLTRELKKKKKKKKIVNRQTERQVFSLETIEKNLKINIKKLKSCKKNFLNVELIKFRDNEECKNKINYLLELIIKHIYTKNFGTKLTNKIERTKNESKQKEELEELKKKINSDIKLKEKNNLEKNNLEKNINFIKDIFNIEKLTIENIFKILYSINGKDYNVFKSRFRYKYKKLLKDINYIKKYMKYKMKYYIMLKKNNLSN